MSRWILYITLPAFLISCSRKIEYDEYVKKEVHSERIRLQYDSDVPGDIKDLVDLDLDYLNRLYFQGTFEDARLFNVTQLDGRALNEFVRRGLKYVVSENFELTSSTYYAVESGRTPQIDGTSASEMSDLLHFSKFSSLAGGDLGASNTVTNASYTSGAVYLDCSKRGEVCEIRLRNGTKILVRSAQAAGVMQLGAGLSRNKTGGNLTDRSNVFARMATEVHEVGHGLSNGASVCMPHPKCPTWHAYSGDNACDDLKWANYARGAATIRITRQLCGAVCSESQKQKLDVIQADYLSRELPNARQVDLRTETLL